jgi:hypothetical protein
MATDTRALLRYFILDQQLRRLPDSTTEELRAYIENEINNITTTKNSYSTSLLKSDIKAMKKILNAPIAFSFTKNRYEYNSNSQFLKMPPLASEYFCNYLRLQLISGKEKQPNNIVHYEQRSIAGNEHLLHFIKAIATRNQISFHYRPFNSKRS